MTKKEFIQYVISNKGVVIRKIDELEGIENGMVNAIDIYIKDKKYEKTNGEYGGFGYGVEKMCPHSDTKHMKSFSKNTEVIIDTDNNIFCFNTIQKFIDYLNE